MADEKSVLERLHRVAQFGETHLTGLWTDAIDEIAALEDEIERLNAENARLRDALKPFAKAGELFGARDGHLDMLIYAPAAGEEYQIVGDDLRRARAALAEKEPKA